MRKAITLFALAILGTSAQAQQDPMFTNYLFNGLTFNPAYAGSRDHLSVNILHRTQWWGINGAPQSQTFNLHSPLKNERVGVGFSAVNDKIGPTSTLNLNGSYAYRIPVGKSSKLSIGVQGSMNNYRANWDDPTLSVEGGRANDPAFAGENPSFWKPNVGMGVYFYNKNFYTGIGVPRLIEYDLTRNRVDQLPFYAKQVRHYYYTIGGAIPLRGDAVVFKPSLLVKAAAPDAQFKADSTFSTVGAPTAFNIDLSLFFQETLWIGASFRSSIEAFNNKSSYDSADFWVAYYLSNGLRIGAAYDYTLTKLQRQAGGSFEVMLGYEFDYKTKRVVTPRYF